MSLRENDSEQPTISLSRYLLVDVAFFRGSQGSNRTYFRRDCNPQRDLGLDPALSQDAIVTTRITPWKINMEPTNHPFRKENDLPNPYDYVPC